MHAVLTTPTFDRQIREAGLSDDEVMAMISWLAEHPLAGALMAGTGGARKVRFARRGSGKSGGYRTIHYYGGEDVPLFLLALMEKGVRANLSKAERNELASVLPGIAEAYRAGATQRASEERGR